MRAALSLPVLFLAAGCASGVPVERQVVIIYAATTGALDSIPVPSLKRWEAEFLAFIDASHADIFEGLRTKKAIDDDIKKKLTDAIAAFDKKFVKDAKK